MADTTQCSNCGAILTEEDVFCGECGAPRPPAAEAAEPTTGEPPVEPESPPDVPPAPEPGPPPAGAPPETGWRVAFIVLAVLGIMACVAGLLGFLLVGSIGGDTTTPAEDWLISALCCLLPVGGTGVILAAVGGAIWYSRLRDRQV